MQIRKYQLPTFLVGKIDQSVYDKWLSRKARAHLRRDLGRGNTTATSTEYKLAIHAAVIASEGRDAYTYEYLDWFLLSKYDNEQSKKHGREYKQLFALLPTVDHVGDGTGPADFKMCSWRTNDSKNDLSYEEFLSLCKKVVEVSEAICR